MPVEITVDQALQLKLRFRCPNCGSEDLKFRGWVDQDGVLIRFMTNDEAWCIPCETHIGPSLIHDDI